MRTFLRTGGRAWRNSSPRTTESTRSPRIDWSETQGTVGFGRGKCTMRAAPSTLIPRAEAIDTEHLRQVQQIVTADIERFCKREHVQVIWQEPVPAD